MTSEIALATITRRWRRVEYERLVDLGMFDDERLELIEGHLVVKEPQGSYHAAFAEEIGRVLGTAFGPGWHARHHAPLALDDDSEPEPDVAIVPGDPRDYLTAHPSTAALVVEVADSSLRLARRRPPAVASALRGFRGWRCPSLADHVAGTEEGSNRRSRVLVLAWMKRLAVSSRRVAP